MSETQKCQRCGASLPKGGNLAGVCAACVMQQSMVTDPASKEPELILTESGPKGPGASSDLPDIEEVRARFPKLEVLELVGRGGMGVVYKARQPHLDRLVALKVLAPNLAEDPHFAERFLREARAMAKLNHPNIVTVYDFGEADGCYFLLMEFIEGAGLRQVMGGKHVTAHEALAIVPQICDALQYAHEQGVVHRDIKPENILMNSHGQVKIADFGLAKLLGNGSSGLTLTRGSLVMGTPHYMAPEQVNSPLEVDHRADIYSLGVVIYEMLTGELPIGRFEAPSSKANVDARLDNVVLKALEREPARRYQHASEVKTDVTSASAGKRVPTTTAKESEDPFADTPMPAVQDDQDGPVPSWIDKFPQGPLAVASIALVLAIAAYAAIWIWGLHRLGDSSAIVYPLAFVMIVAMRSNRIPAAEEQTRTGMRALGFLACCFVATGLASGMAFPRGKWMLDAVAGILIVSGHLLLDRWIRGQSAQSLAAYAVLLILASVTHAATSNYRGLSYGLYYAFGMLALQAGTSALMVVPEYFWDPIPRAARMTVARGLGIGIPAAFVYFWLLRQMGF